MTWVTRGSDTSATSMVLVHLNYLVPIVLIQRFWVVVSSEELGESGVVGSRGLLRCAVDLLNSTRATLVEELRSIPLLPFLLLRRLYVVC